MKNLLLVILCIASLSTFAQVGINATGSAPDNSAMLDISSNNKGFLAPRMTSAERYAISNPAMGLMVFDTNDSCYHFHNGAYWMKWCGYTCDAFMVTAGSNSPVGTTNDLLLTAPHSGGASILSYSWTGPNGFSAGTQNPTRSSVVLADSGLYIVQVTDVNGCVATDSVEVSIFESCPATVTDIDGNSYPTTYVGNQCWMAKNLNTTKDPQGNSITRYCYSGSGSNCTTYGGFYLWDEVMNGESPSSSNPSGVQGICPNGWHLPSDDEWCELEAFLGKATPCDTINFTGSTDEALKMKSTSGWNAGGNGNNSSGMNILPAGNLVSAPSSYSDLSLASRLWTATEYSPTEAWYRAFWYGYDTNARNRVVKTRGFSVRCVKDQL